MRKKRKGFFDVSMMTIIAIVLMIALVVALFEYAPPLVRYINIGQVARSTILKMEKDGGLTSSERSKLMIRLKDMGLDMTKMTITATAAGTVDFGDDIVLQIDYTTKVATKDVDGINVSTDVKNMPMRFYKVSTSKKKV
ncbi:hypothetical protein D3C81_10020 [compost metagenome]